MAMASSVKSTSLCFFITVVFFLCSSNFCFSSEPTPTPTPTPWPYQFHAVLFVNNSGFLRKTDLWYDWVSGRNFNILQKQLGELLYGLEWNNGTSFYYTLDESKKCRIMQFGVGILRPNWLEGAEYLGQRHVDGFLCNVWQKADFIWYYEDVDSKRPVHWVFYDGMESHVMTYEVGAVLEDEKWQAPVYCFNEAITKDDAFGGVSERMWLDPFLQERRRDS